MNATNVTDKKQSSTHFLGECIDEAIHICNILSINALSNGFSTAKVQTKYKLCHFFVKTFTQNPFFCAI